METLNMFGSPLSDLEITCLYWLWSLPVLGAVSVRRLYERFRSFERLYHIEETELKQEKVLSEKQCAALMAWKSEFFRCEQEYHCMKENKIRCVTPFDLEYPKRLLEIRDFPMMLFSKGGFPKDEVPAVAIVGARGCSAYGEQITSEFSRMLAEEGVQIISGLAVGIDGAAHRGCLKSEMGMTYGVLGCGVNICYPPQHFALYENMQERGGILSEFPVNCEPLKRNFPMRNRIISALADAILVTEAKERSGSLITADLGLDQGREIFAVPGRITDNLSFGCNHLIAQGAHPALSPEDILEYLGVRHQKKLIIKEKNTQSLAKKEKIVYSCLDFKSHHLDQIAQESGLSVTECMGILLDLELSGYVYRSSNSYYGRKI